MWRCHIAAYGMLAVTISALLNALSNVDVAVALGNIKATNHKGAVEPGGEAAGSRHVGQLLGASTVEDEPERITFRRSTLVKRVVVALCDARDGVGGSRMRLGRHKLGHSLQQLNGKHIGTLTQREQQCLWAIQGCVSNPTSYSSPDGGKSFRMVLCVPINAPSSSAGGVQAKLVTCVVVEERRGKTPILKHLVAGNHTHTHIHTPAL